MVHGQVVMLTQTLIHMLICDMWYTQKGSQRIQHITVLLWTLPSLQYYSRLTESGCQNVKEAHGVVGMHPVPSVAQQMHLMAKLADHLLVLATPPAFICGRHTQR